MAKTENNKLCYICSPYKGNIIKRLRNIRYAKKLTNEAVRRGYIPVTPHLYLTRVYNDNRPRDREIGLRVGQELLCGCGQIMIGTKYGISEGMVAEVDISVKNNIPAVMSETNPKLSPSQYEKRAEEIRRLRLIMQVKEKQQHYRNTHKQYFRIYAKKAIKHLLAAKGW